MSDKGVLLVNLGTPDAPETSEVTRFLTRFLSDPRVVDLPRWLWIPLLRLVIIPLRKGRITAAYKKIWLSRGSPLMVYSEDLCAGLQQHLGERIKVVLAMRHGEPDISNGLATLQAAGVNNVLVLSLYPQYSVTTTESVFDAVSTALSDMNWHPDLHLVRQYHDSPGWIHSIASSVRNFQIQHGKPERLLFSMHGLPRRLVEAGDPYEQQCLQSVADVTEILDMKDTSLITFQSRVGREPWLKPYTDEVIRALAESGVKHIQVISPGFAVDCLETLEEIGIRYRDLFTSCGGEKLEYIPALNGTDTHVRALGSVVEQTFD